KYRTRPPNIHGAFDPHSRRSDPVAVGERHLIADLFSDGKRERATVQRMPFAGADTHEYERDYREKDNPSNPTVKRAQAVIRAIENGRLCHVPRCSLRGHASIGEQGRSLK